MKKKLLLMKNIFITTFLIFVSFMGQAHESESIESHVVVNKDVSGGKIVISEEAAKAIFDTLASGCKVAHLISRFGDGVACFKDSQKNIYSCSIVCFF